MRKKCLDKRFRKNVRMDVRVCVYACEDLGKFEFLYLRNYAATRTKI